MDMGLSGIMGRYDYDHIGHAVFFPAAKVAVGRPAS